MRLKYLVGIICLMLCAIAFNRLHAQNCASIDAGPDDTICAGQTVQLNGTYSGPAGTSFYQPSFIGYTPYTFVGGQTVLNNLDDAWSAAIPLPFCFEFYGTVYTQLVIGTNGIVTFDITQANGICPWTINVAAPNPGLPLNSIMAPFHDIDPMIPVPGGNTSINYQVFGQAPCREFVVSWNEIAMYGNGCSSIISTSQVVLHETTYMIDIFIANKGVCSAWNNGAAIEGLQNANGTAASIIPGRNFPTQWNVTTDGVRFTPAGAPAATIQWLDPSNVVVGTGVQAFVNPTQTSNYTFNVTYTPCNGVPVSYTDQVNIVVNQNCLSAGGGGGGILCAGGCTGTITVTATNGTPPYTYQWSPALPATSTQSGLCAGTYTCVVSDVTGFSVTVIQTLTSPPGFTVTPSATATLCNTSTGTASVSVVGSGVYTYAWDTGDTTAIASNLAAGTYTVVVTDLNGCTASATVTVAPTGLNLSAQSTSLLCDGDCNAVSTVTAGSGIAPFSYSWLPSGGNAAIANSLCAGSYTCTVVDAANCTTAVNVSIISPPPIVVSPASNQTICNGESVVLSAVVSGGTQPYSYVWNNNLPAIQTHTVTPSQTTIYTVDVTDANGCSAPQQSTQVKVHPDPIVSFYSIEAQCPPALVQFTNLTDTAVSYQWNFGDPSSGGADNSVLVHPSHMYTQSGVFMVTLIATNQWGCSDTLTLPSVAVPASPTAQISVASQVLVSVDPTSTIFNSTSGADYYFIDFGDGDTMTTTISGPYIHTYDSVGSFTVMLVAWNNLGCSDTAWIVITIEEPTTCWVPDAFTPNGSGPNDLFLVSGINVETFHLMIFDRWGKLIFTTNDILHGWDGTYQGNKCQVDVYVWKLSYTDNLAGEHYKMGHVSLIR